MELRNLGWIADKVAYLLQFNPSQSDQDFQGPSSNANKWTWDLINQAYEVEVNNAKLGSIADRFMVTQDMTWTASAVTAMLPEGIRRHGSLRMADVTDDSIGLDLDFNRHNIFWKDYRTLQWGTQGPGRATSIRITYLANVVEMTSDSDEPEWVPYSFRRLIVWRAAIIGRIVADDKAPTEWYKQAKEWRENWISHESMGAPMFNNPPTIGREMDF